MDKLKRNWKKVPDTPRRALVFVGGVLLIIAAPLIGWVPGPGGMIVFLLGIAVLASEFSWAERLKNMLLDFGKQLIAYAKLHPYITSLCVLGVLIFVSYGAYVFYTKII